MNFGIGPSSSSSPVIFRIAIGLPAGLLVQGLGPVRVPLPGSKLVPVMDTEEGSYEGKLAGGLPYEVAGGTGGARYPFCLPLRKGILTLKRLFFLVRTNCFCAFHFLIMPLFGLS